METKQDKSDREKRVRRQVLEPDTLQALLPLRAEVVARVGAKPEAQARERAFAAASPAYARAVETRDEFAGNIKVITLDSLTWSVPLLAPNDPDAVARYLSTRTSRIAPSHRRARPASGAR